MERSVSPLRDRRRRQTAREIQQATLSLAERHGFDAVTTEMIAHEAGMSVRTFFNYYTNKEAAAVGHVPRFRDEALEAFVSGQATVMADLATLLHDHLRDLDEDRGVIRSMIVLARGTPRLTMMHIDTMRDLKERLTEALVGRMSDVDPETLDLLAEVAIGCARRAIHLWVEDDGMSIVMALQAALGRLQEAALLLTGETR